MKRNFLGIAFGALAVMFAPQAQGALSFALDVDCDSACGTPPFGTVLLTAIDVNTIDVKVTLNSPFEFVKTGAGNSVQFRIDGLPVTVQNVTTGFAATAPKTSGPLSGFNYAIECSTGCGPGGSDTNPGPLEFTLFRASGFGANLLDAEKSLLQNNTTNKYYFSADIIGPGGTGNVFALGTPVVVTPEPLTMSLVGVGLLLIGLRKAKNRLAA